MNTDDLIKIKTKKTNLPVSNFFKNRFSPRVFSSKIPKDKDIKTIFEAVKFTPSSYNRQPWFFYLAKNGSKRFLKLINCLMSGNDWANNVPILILACYINPDEKGDNNYAQYDLGQAVATLVYQAQILGYYTHQIAGFYKEKLLDLVEKNQHPHVLITLGKIGDYQKAEKRLVKIDSQPPIRKQILYQII